MAFLWYSPYFLRMKSSVGSVLLLSNHQMQNKVKAILLKTKEQRCVDREKHNDKYKQYKVLLVLYLLLLFLMQDFIIQSI